VRSLLVETSFDTITRARERVGHEILLLRPQFLNEKVNQPLRASRNNINRNTRVSAGKLQFRRSLATWKAELGTEHSDNFTTRYPGKVALLRAEVAAVRNDFEGPRRKKFDKLVLDLCSLITEQISHHPNKDPVTQLVSRLTR
jgi:hypothetical protein